MAILLGAFLPIAPLAHALQSTSFNFDTEDAANKELQSSNFRFQSAPPMAPGSEGGDDSTGGGGGTTGGGGGSTGEGGGGASTDEPSGGGRRASPDAEPSGQEEAPLVFQPSVPAFSEIDPIPSAERKEAPPEQRTTRTLKATATPPVIEETAKEPTDTKPLKQTMLVSFSIALAVMVVLGGMGTAGIVFVRPFLKKLRAGRTSKKMRMAAARANRTEWHIRTLSVLLLVSLALSLVPFERVHAITTTPLNHAYNGRLLDSAGEPLTTAHTFRFSYWKSSDHVAGDTTATGAINTGATQYVGWQEVHTITPDSNGYVSITLGSVTALPGMDSLPFGTLLSLFMQVEVKASASADTAYELLDTNTSSTTIDRPSVLSAAFALNADMLDQHDVGTGSGSIPVLLSGGLLPVSAVPGGTNRDTFTLDNDGGASTVTLQFGGGLAKKLTYDSNTSLFSLNAPLQVQGAITATGALTAKGHMSGASLNVSGNTTVGGALTTSGALTVKGQMSGASLNVSGNTTVGGTAVVTGNLTTRGTLSGASLNVSGNTTMGGATVVTGNLTTKGTLSGASLNVSGNTTMGGATVVTGNLTTKGTLSGATLNVSGNTTMRGTAVVTGNLTTKGTLSGVSLRISGNSDVHGAMAVSGALRTDSTLTLNDDRSAGDATLTFGNTIANQTLKFVDTLQEFQFSKGMRITGTISGSSLHVDGTAHVRGNLTTSGTTMVVGNLTTRGALSGASITVSSLRNCDTIDTNASGVFTCGDDETGGGSAFGTGNVITVGDARFVNQSGDTMTGALTVRATLSGSALRVSGAASVHGVLTVTGSITTDGDLVLNDDRTASTDAILTFGNQVANQTLKFSNTAQRFTFSTNVSVLGTLSGSIVHADAQLRSSGSLIVEGGMSGGTLQGANLSDCDDGTNSKLLWDATTKKFSCGADNAVGSGLSQTTGDARYVNLSGDTMTGALAINVTGGTQNTVGLNVRQTASGAHVHAQQRLSSSGTVVWEGSGSGSALYISTSFNGAGLTDCDATSQKLQWDASTGRFSCGTIGGPDTAVFSDTNPAAFNGDNDTVELFNDATKPNITLDSTSSTVLIHVQVIDATAVSTDDEFNAIRIIRETDGTDPSCSGGDTQVGPAMQGGFVTAATQPWGIGGSVLDSPGVAGTVKYTVCSSANSLATTVDNAADRIEVTIIELGADLAENYYTKDSTLKAGHVVTIDASLPAGVKKSTGALDANILGIVSTQPGLVLDDAIGLNMGRAVPIALSGRVPVNVTTENGPIVVGDLLGPSSTPGSAMKARKGGPVVGQALTAFDGKGTAMVLAFVKTLPAQQPATPAMGVATLIGGTATVPMPAITAKSQIMLTPQSGSPNSGSLWIASRIIGKAFTILSSNPKDDRSIGWMLFEQQ